MEGFNFEPSGLANDLPILSFEEGSYSISELLDSHLLPLVVQYDTTRQPLPLTEFNFDLTQPLLLYKKRNIQKVAARSLFVENGRYKEVGESLLIPEDYKGWFAVLQRVTGNHAADDNVPHFTSIEELANSNTDKFLIGGTKRINGLQINDRSENRLNHEPRIFLPGDVLTREKLYFGETQKKTRLFRRPKYITEKFLMCRDESDRDVLLPFDQTGIFYQVSHRGGKATRNVLQMSDIVARKLTPRFIKLVYGRLPVTTCAFTGLMKADSSGIETTVIAATIVHKKNVLMEMPVSSDMYFRIALTDDGLRMNPCFQNAKSLCAEKASTYMRNIKVCYNFTSSDDGGPVDNMPHLSSNRSSSGTLGSAHSQTFMGECVRTSDEIKDLKPISTKIETKADDKPDTNEVVIRNKMTPFRMSEDITPNVIMRPAKALSTSRMSFCLGNNYLTIPIIARTIAEKRDSGNNNTNPVATYPAKRGSRISMNGTFIEEVETPKSDGTLECQNETASSPVLSCTNLGVYVNAVSPPDLPTDASDYRPASSTKRPSTTPPAAAPPPLPNSCSTSGVSSGSLSSVSDDTASKRGSSSSFEYAVPKNDAAVIRSNTSDSSNFANADTEKLRMRRPSTFTFSEGCYQNQQSFPSFPVIKDVDEEPDMAATEDERPVYENIRELMEIVSQFDDNRDDELNTTNDDIRENCESTEILGYNDTIDDLSLSENAVLHNVNTESRDAILPPEPFDEMLSTTADVPDEVNKPSEVELSAAGLLNGLKIDEHETVDGGEAETVSGDDKTVPVSTDVSNRDFFEAIPDRNDQQCVPSSSGCIGRGDGIQSDTGGSVEVEQGEECLWNVVVNKGRRDSPSRRLILEEEKHFSLLDNSELSNMLRTIGIKEDSIAVVEEKGIDGLMLADILNGDNVELGLRACLRGVHLVDQQKISMFIRGWRPDNDG